MPTRTKTESETALPTEAIELRSKRLTNSRISATVIRRPPCRPRRDCWPKSGGNWPTCARVPVKPFDAYSVAFTDEDVARSAAIVTAVKPAFPSAGRAASATAVAPYLVTSATVSVPKTPTEIATYRAVVPPSAVYIARGRLRSGSRQIAGREADDREAEIGEERQGDAGDDRPRRRIARRGEQMRVEFGQGGEDENGEDRQQRDDDRRLRLGDTRARRPR